MRPYWSEWWSPRYAANFRTHSTFAPTSTSAIAHKLRSRRLEIRSLCSSHWTVFVECSCSACWLLETSLTLRKVVCLDLNSELQSPIEVHRDVYLSIQQPLLTCILETCEAWLAELFILIENTIDYLLFVNLDCLIESLICWCLPVLKDIGLKIAIDDENG